MAFTPPFTIDGADFNAPRADREAVAKVLPHRGAFAQLDAVVAWDDDFTCSIGTRFIRDDEFWIDGHFPDRPLFPGVLMIETAAQLCAFTNKMSREDDPLFGFVRCDECAFRGQVVPGDTIHFYAMLVSSNRRRFVSRVQAFVNERLVMEATVTGMTL